MSETPAKALRLQKILSQMGMASRREAEEWIENGEVTLNGQVAKLGDQALPGVDHVKVRGKLIQWQNSPRQVVVAVYKPRGLLADRPQDQIIDRDTVYELIRTVKERVYPVGRLDSDTEGLMLLTNHGDLKARLTKGKYEIERRYMVKVDGHMIEKKLRRLNHGVPVEGKKVALKEIRFTKQLDGKEWLVAITTEPQNRMIRKVFEAVGHPVDKVRLEGIGPITIKGLKRGEFRYLSPSEIEELEVLVGLKKKSPAQAAREIAVAAEVAKPRGPRPRKKMVSKFKR
ncbi:MAG TPA: pseudouridine synthase [Bdellovibrionota bacterium]|nr:pseudouridine synthase [Bdellovibrionota bacterium]